MENVLSTTKKRLFVKLAALSLSSIMAAACILIWLCWPRFAAEGLIIVPQLLLAACSTAFVIGSLFLINMVCNVADIRVFRVFSFLDKYIFFFINTLFPLIVLWGKLFKIPRRRIERSFIALNNYILTHKKIKVAAKDLLVISPHCLQLASCPYKITYDIKNCHRCNRCTVGPLITMSEKLGFNFRVVTGGTLARKIARELHPKMVLAIACERDLASGIQDVYPLPAAGVLNIRPNGPCYNTTVDLKLVESTIRQFIK